MKSFHFFGTLRKSFSDFGETFSAGLSKLHSTCLVEHFTKKCGKVFFGLLSKKFGLQAKIFRQGCQNCVLRVQRNILAQKFFRKFFDCLRALKDMLDFGRKFSESVLRVLRNILGFFNISNVIIITPTWQIPEKKVFILME